MTYTKELIKQAYMEVYGREIYDHYYSSFDEAFDAAWSVWQPKPDTNLEDIWDVIEDICDNCSALWEK